MNPAEIGKSYDVIADRWQAPEHRLSGVDQHRRAMKFVKTRGHALYVGCGCNGRFIGLLTEHGFTVEGVDVSERMIALARQRNPEIQFYHDDICQWTLPRKYDFITAWDRRCIWPLWESRTCRRCWRNMDVFADTWNMISIRNPISTSLRRRGRDLGCA